MNSRIIPLILIAMVAPAFSQQAPEAEKTPSAAQRTTSTSRPASDDAEAATTAAAIAKANAAAAANRNAATANADYEASIAKKAKEFGWYPEVRKGATVYCRQAPGIGSRFTEKRCASPIQLAAFLEQQQFEKDQLQPRGCGGNCGAR